MPNKVIEHPSHYTFGNIECIEAIEASMSPEEFRGFLKGQVLKYMWRLNRKDSGAQDAGKAKWYLELLQKKLASQP